jgi:glycosyltransferase involved in cell wall biosynthesis
MILSSWLDFYFLGIALLWFWAAAGMCFHLRWARRLPRLETLQTAKAPSEFPESLFGNSFSQPSTLNPQPNSQSLLTSSAAFPTGSDGRSARRVSVVLAARDEEARIENTVRRLFAQRGIDLEVIVVDDRSKDRTSEILQRLAAEFPGLKVKRVDVLPEGWLGKCHACHLGAASVTGDWILFTDADCWLKSDVIVRAWLVAERVGADHVTMTPGIAGASPAAAAWHLAFLLSLANWFSGVNRDKPKAYLGLGAFNFVRTDAYRVCGGYEALRLTVLDDVRLGLLLRRADKRTRGFIGGDDTECHWGTTARAMIQIMEKNYFAAVDFRTGLVISASIFAPLVWCGAVLGPFTGSLSGLAAGLGLLSLSVPAGVLAGRLGWSRWLAMLTPFAFPLLFYAIWNSMVVTLRNGGIRWRDTFYPLEMLRRGTVR